MRDAFAGGAVHRPGRRGSGAAHLLDELLGRPNILTSKPCPLLQDALSSTGHSSPLRRRLPLPGSPKRGGGCGCRLQAGSGEGQPLVAPSLARSRAGRVRWSWTSTTSWSANSTSSTSFKPRRRSATPCASPLGGGLRSPKISRGRSVIWRRGSRLASVEVGFRRPESPNSDAPPLFASGQGEGRRWGSSCPVRF
jgi:hypothetical protein